MSDAQTSVLGAAEIARLTSYATAVQQQTYPEDPRHSLATAVLRFAEARRTEARRNVAAMKVIARHYHDENGNRVRAGHDGIDEIGDILCGLRDVEIAAEIDAARVAEAAHV